MMKKSKTLKIFSIFLCGLLIFQQTGFAQVANVELNIAGHFTSLANTFSLDKFRPLHLRSISYDGISNFKLLLDKGDTRNQKTQDIESTSKDLLNYFFVGLALPQDTFWVNLRPDSPNDIIDPLLAQTEVGKILLEADLQLKKDTANATNPGTPEGKAYWNKLYQKAGELYGNQNVTIPTLTRPWIVPDEIIIRESTNSAYVYKATLKVMLEQDYLKGNATYSFKDEREKQLNEYSAQIIREEIIPKLTKAINNAKRYAPLRQVYFSLILAQWFKASNLNKNTQYSGRIDRKDLTNLQAKTPYSVGTYFNAYKENFEKGEYNIQEPVYTPYGQVIRSYLSGGIGVGFAPVVPSGPGATLGRVTKVADSAVLNVNTKLIPGDLTDSGVDLVVPHDEQQALPEEESPTEGSGDIGNVEFEQSTPANWFKKPFLTVERNVFIRNLKGLGITPAKQEQILEIIDQSADPSVIIRKLQRIIRNYKSSEPKQAVELILTVDQKYNYIAKLSELLELFGESKYAHIPNFFNSLASSVDPIGYIEQSLELARKLRRNLPIDLATKMIDVLSETKEPLEKYAQLRQLVDGQAFISFSAALGDPEKPGQSLINDYVFSRLLKQILASENYDLVLHEYTRLFEALRQIQVVIDLDDLMYGVVMYLTEESTITEGSIRQFVDTLLQIPNIPSVVRAIYKQYPRIYKSDIGKIIGELVRDYIALEKLFNVEQQSAIRTLFTDVMIRAFSMVSPKGIPFEQLKIRIHLLVDTAISETQSVVSEKLQSSIESYVLKIFWESTPFIGNTSQAQRLTDIAGTLSPVDLNIVKSIRTIYGLGDDQDNREKRLKQMTVDAIQWLSEQGVLNRRPTETVEEQMQKMSASARAYLKSHTMQLFIPRIRALRAMRKNGIKRPEQVLRSLEKSGSPIIFKYYSENIQSTHYENIRNNYQVNPAGRVADLDIIDQRISRMSNERVGEYDFPLQALPFFQEIISVDEETYQKAVATVQEHPFLFDVFGSYISRYRTTRYESAFGSSQEGPSSALRFLTAIIQHGGFQKRQEKALSLLQRLYDYGVDRDTLGNLLISYDALSTQVPLLQDLLVILDAIGQQKKYKNNERSAYVNYREFIKNVLFSGSAHILAQLIREGYGMDAGTISAFENNYDDYIVNREKLIQSGELLLRHPYAIIIALSLDERISNRKGRELMNIIKDAEQVEEITNPMTLAIQRGGVQSSLLSFESSVVEISKLHGVNSETQQKIIDFGNQLVYRLVQNRLLEFFNLHPERINELLDPTQPLHQMLLAENAFDKNYFLKVPSISVEDLPRYFYIKDGQVRKNALFLEYVKPHYSLLGLFRLLLSNNSIHTLDNEFGSQEEQIYWSYALKLPEKQTEILLTTNIERVLRPAIVSSQGTISFDELVPLYISEHTKLGAIAQVWKDVGTVMSEDVLLRLPVSLQRFWRLYKTVSGIGGILTTDSLKLTATDTTDALFFSFITEKAQPETIILLREYLDTHGFNIRTVEPSPGIYTLLSYLPKDQWLTAIRRRTLLLPAVQTFLSESISSPVSEDSLKELIGQIRAEVESQNRRFNEFQVKLVHGYQPQTEEDFKILDIFLASIDDHYIRSFTELAEQFNVPNWQVLPRWQVLKIVSSQLTTIPLKSGMATFPFVIRESFFTIPDTLRQQVQAFLGPFSAQSDASQVDYVTMLEGIGRILSPDTIKLLLDPQTKAETIQQILPYFRTEGQDVFLRKIDGIIASKLSDEQKLTNLTNVLAGALSIDASLLNEVWRDIFKLSNLDTLIPRFLDGTLSASEMNLFISQIGELVRQYIPDYFSAHPKLAYLQKTLEATDGLKLIKQVNAQSIETIQQQDKNTKMISLVFTPRTLLDLWQGVVSGTCFADHPAHLSKRGNIVPVKMVKDGEVFGNALFLIQPGKLILIGFDPSVSFTSVVASEKMHEFIDRCMEVFVQIADANKLEFMIATSVEVGGLSNRGGVEEYITQVMKLDQSTEISIIPEERLHPDHGYEPQHARKLDSSISKTLRGSLKKPSFKIQTPASQITAVPQISVPQVDYQANKTYGLSYSPSISSTGKGDETQANRNILEGILNILIKQGKITEAEGQRRLEAFDANPKSGLAEDLDLVVDNQNVYMINNQKIVVIDTSTLYLSITEEGEQYASAGLRRGVVYITRNKFNEWNGAGTLGEKIKHEQDEVNYLRKKATEMFTGLDETTAYELFSDFLKNPDNQKQARDLISEAHQYAQSQGHPADVSVIASPVEAGAAGAFNALDLPGVAESIKSLENDKGRIRGLKKNVKQLDRNNRHLSAFGKTAGLAGSVVYYPFGGFDPNTPFMLVNGATDVFSVGLESFGSIADIEKFCRIADSSTKAGRELDGRFESGIDMVKIMRDYDLSGLGALAIAKIVSLLDGKIEKISYFEIQEDGSFRFLEENEMQDKNILPSQSAVVEFVVRDPVSNKVIKKRYWYIQQDMSKGFFDYKQEFYDYRYSEGWSSYIWGGEERYLYMDSLVDSGYLNEQGIIQPKIMNGFDNFDTGVSVPSEIKRKIFDILYNGYQSNLRYSRFIGKLQFQVMLIKGALDMWHKFNDGSLNLIIQKTLIPARNNLAIAISDSRAGGVWSNLKGYAPHPIWREQPNAIILKEGEVFGYSYREGDYLYFGPAAWLINSASDQKAKDVSLAAEKANKYTEQFVKELGVSNTSFGGIKRLSNPKARAETIDNKIYINSLWIDQMSEDEIERVIAHEVQHRRTDFLRGKNDLKLGGLSNIKKYQELQKRIGDLHDKIIQEKGNVFAKPKSQYLENWEILSLLRGYEIYRRQVKSGVQVTTQSYEFIEAFTEQDLDFLNEDYLFEITKDFKPEIGEDIEISPEELDYKEPIANSEVKSIAPDKGGIDFRFLPVVVQSMDNLRASIGTMSQNSLQRINLTQEWSDIERFVNSGITPSAERLKEYLAASCFKGGLDRDMEKIVSCIADILRMQEQTCCVTDPVLKDILVVLGSGRSAEELKVAFSS
jgi:hypothetical protein